MTVVSLAFALCLTSLSPSPLLADTGSQGGRIPTLSLAASSSPEPGASPRSAARAYLEAVLRGDAAAALALVADPSDADRLVVKAHAASAGALRRLEDVATSRFGTRGDLGVAARQRRLLAALARAPEEVAGDRAVLRPEGERPVHLRRVEGKWKIESPAERLTGAERRELERALERTESVAHDLAEQIRERAVKSAEEARAALKKALGQDEPEGVPL
jgi:hypothetical protein